VPLYPAKPQPQPTHPFATSLLLPNNVTKTFTNKPRGTLQKTTEKEKALEEENQDVKQTFKKPLEYLADTKGTY
jgi:hypothetical protein